MRRAVLALALALSASTALAGSKYVLTDHPGGSIREHAEWAEDMRAAGHRPVFAEGRTYRSAVIMLLSVPGACVEPGAVFVFHGPSWNGQPMGEADALYWSKEIARHYPAKLGRWFMTKGRFATYRANSAWVIAMGAKAC